MRSVTLSTDVFAKIWSLRRVGENSEDEILRRILSLGASETTSAAPRDSFGGGVFDGRQNVVFPEDFEVFRTYLGVNWSAKSVGGRWVLNDGRQCGSLNELSRAIGAKTENAWQNWHFADQFGQRQPVSNMRDPAAIMARKRQRQDGSQPTTENVAGDSMQPLADATWRDDVQLALTRLGGEASLQRIYKEVGLIRKNAGRSLPRSIEATIRRTLEDHSSDSDNYRGADLFHMPRGKGAGIWGLRTTTTLDQL